MSLTNLTRSLLLSLLVLAGAWGALVLIFAAPVALSGAVAWDEALRRASTFWRPWLLLLPVVWGLTRWLLARPRPAVVHVLAHALAGTAVVFLCHAAAAERPVGGPYPHREEAPDVPGRPAPDRAGRPPGPPPGGVPRGEGMGPPWSRGGPPGRPPRPESSRPRGPFGPLGFRAVLDAVVYAGVVGMTCAAAFLQRSRQRERRTLELEASLAKARLDALRLQINPHFLFNALNAIASLVHTRPDAADDMIGSLSGLLRASLQGDGRHEVPLDRELELLRLYTDIERTRFGDRLRFEQVVDPDVSGALVPALVLQPLVENAVRHGLEPRPGPGTVRLTARREGDRLVVFVADDGVGCDAAQQSRGSGIGLTNVRDRLRALHGAAASLAIDPAPGGGTVVTLTLPFKLS